MSERCKHCPSIVLTNGDVGRIAEYFDWDEFVFRGRFNLKLNPYKPGTWLMQGDPCPFLEEGNRCSIYPVRPEACRMQQEAVK